MTDQNAGKLSLVSLSQSLNVNDVLSVVTSRAESRLHRDLSEAKKKLREAEEEIAKCGKEATQRYKSECLAAAEAVAEKLRAAVESVGGKVQIASKEYWAYEQRRRNDNGLLEQDVRIVSPSGYHNTATFTATAEPSTTLLELEARAAAAREHLATCQSEALAVRKRLANVPMLERQARARLAEAKLLESEDGRAVLDALTSEFEADFLALPSN